MNAPRNEMTLHEHALQEAAIQAATAREAMQEALGLLREAGYADHITTRKLAAVLAKETA